MVYNLNRVTFANTMKQIDPKTIRAYPALRTFLGYAKLPKNQEEYALKQITSRLVKDSKISSFPEDFSDFYRYFLETVVDPLKKDIAKINKSEDAEIISYIPWQMDFLKKMTFVDAILPLLEFQKFVRAIRKEFEIQPKTLLRDLGFSKEQLGKATYGANPQQIDAVLRKLGEFKEIRERHQLALKKEKFEKQFFSNYIKRKKTLILKSSVAPIKINGRRLWIPKHQRVHVRNYILYGISTGNLFSLHGSNKGQGREWERRILKDSEKKGYIPFLRNYFYYFYRVCRGEKSIKKTNEALCDLGFPPTTRREHDHTMKSRYERLFLK